MHTIKEVVELTYTLDTGEQLAGDDAEAVEKLLLLAIQKGKIPAYCKKPDDVNFADFVTVADLMTKQGVEKIRLVEIGIGVPSRILHDLAAVPESCWLIDRGVALALLKRVVLTVRGVPLRNLLLMNVSNEHKGNAIKPYAGELLTLDEANAAIAEVGLTQLSERDWLKVSSTGACPLWWPYEGDVFNLDEHYSHESHLFQGHLIAHPYQLKAWLDGMAPKYQEAAFYQAANGRAYKLASTPEFTAAMLRIRHSDVLAFIEAQIEPKTEPELPESDTSKEKIAFQRADLIEQYLAKGDKPITVLDCRKGYIGTHGLVRAAFCGGELPQMSVNQMRDAWRIVLARWRKAGKPILG